MDSVLLYSVPHCMRSHTVLCSQRDDIRNLEERARKEEEEIVKSRQIIDDEAKQFEITIKANNDMAHDAVQNAGCIIQLRNDKSMEVNDLRKEIEAIQKELDEDRKELERNLHYKAFLDEPTLKSWLHQQTHLKQLQGQQQHTQHTHQVGRSNPV